MAGVEASGDPNVEALEVPADPNVEAVEAPADPNMEAVEASGDLIVLPKFCSCPSCRPFLACCPLQGCRGPFLTFWSFSPCRRCCLRCWYSTTLAWLHVFHRLGTALGTLSEPERRNREDGLGSEHAVPER